MFLNGSNNIVYFTLTLFPLKEKRNNCMENLHVFILITSLLLSSHCSKVYLFPSLPLPVGWVWLRLVLVHPFWWVLAARCLPLPSGGAAPLPPGGCYWAEAPPDLLMGCHHSVEQS